MAKKSKKKSEKDLKTDVNDKSSTTETVNEDLSENENSKQTSGQNGKQKMQDKENEEILQQKIDELNDKYLRLYSEYDNYRKRTLKEKLDLIKTASEEVIAELLPVIDDMERAIKSSSDVKECAPVNEGFILIYNKMKSVLEKKGLKPIESVGKQFDTDFHEAVTFIEAPSEELKGKIMEEIEKGYTLNEKVIRYTKAVIGQ
jgi:molecular chaperone GrpE